MSVFKEEQRFNQLWIMVVLAMSAIVPLLFFTKAYSNNEMSLQSFLIASSLIALSCLLIFVFKLTTKIDRAGIHYKFYPVHLSFRLIRWEDIEEVYTRKYNAITEYGGWGCKGGILWKKENGVAFNISDEEGIQILTKNGKKILIGTQQVTNAQYSIKYYFKNTTTNA